MKSNTKYPVSLDRVRNVTFRQSHLDYGHNIVSRFRIDGSKEVIGHVYTEVDGEEIKYISTNRRGKEIFSPSTDFTAIEKKFDRYAHLIALQERIKENYKEPLITNNHSSLNSNLMKSNNPEQNQRKVNQLIFAEYEKTAGDGHFITVVDSYRNVIGRIHKSYNDEAKKYEYAAFDHKGSLMAQKDKLWELKKEFINNREPLLEQAHQRRIANKEESKEKLIETLNEVPQQTQKATRVEERKKETEMVRHGKEKENLKTRDKFATKNLGKDTKQEREQELTDLRNDHQDERGDIEMER